MKRLGILLFVATACFRDPITAPADTTLTLAATSATVPLDGSVDVVVEVLDPTGKTVKDGTPITLVCCTAPGPAAASAGASLQPEDSVATSALGTLEPALVRTVNGKATARFRAGRRSGTAYVVARSGGARPGTLQLAIGGAAVAQIALTASPAIVSSSSGPVELRATVIDEFGNGVAGVSVAFAASAGILADLNAVTDASGQATTRIATNRETTVTAIAGPHTAATTIRLSPPPSLSMSATPRSPMTGEIVQFSVVAAASTDGPPVRELLMDFGDGARTSISGLAGTTSVAHSYTNPGVYHATSTVIDVLGERATSTAVISVVARPLVSVVLELPAGQIITTGAPFVVNAVVTPASEASRVVRFEWDFGDDARPATTGAACTHVFASAGTRIISVRAVLVDGTATTAETTVVVKPPA